MPRYEICRQPFVVPITDGKIIEEHHGVATTSNREVSIAHMIAPPNWSEPFQQPQFDEYTYVISGKKQFIIDNDIIILHAGESIKIEKNARVQYSNPFEKPCEYISICTPAFSIENVHREI